jgi:hypothetical protein
MIWLLVFLLLLVVAEELIVEILLSLWLEGKDCPEILFKRPKSCRLGDIKHYRPSLRAVVLGSSVVHCVRLCVVVVGSIFI